MTKTHLRYGKAVLQEELFNRYKSTKKKTLLILCVLMICYKRLVNKPIHKRSWKFHKSSLIIEDNIDVYFKNLCILFFHPKLNILRNDNKN